MSTTVIIPSRNEQFLTKTIQDVLSHAETDLEVIAVLDGYRVELPEDQRVHYIENGQAKGMRRCINEAAAVARGDFLMKIDAHCSVGQGFDRILAESCALNTVVIPRRKRLDAENWCVQDVGKPDVDYEFLSFPDDPQDFGGPGLNGKIWDERAVSRKDIAVDENMSFQGSCWFMRKSYFEFLELMDEEHYGTFWNEAQEIGLKAWLSGGKVLTNKNTWYAHLHKGKKYGRGYSLDGKQLTIGATYTKRWIREKMWHKQELPFSWIIEHFWPVPTWPDNWKELLSV